MLTVYRASAGSGKTFRLTGEYIRLLFNEDPNFNPHRSILAVTFTNKATEEMKSRILSELHKLANGQPSPYLSELLETYPAFDEEMIRQRAGKLLINILHDYSSFSISTIDKFFQQVIRAFAREIGVHGGYALELDKNPILEQAVDNLFFELSADENKLLLDWLTSYAEEKIDQSENWNMRKDILSLGQEIFKENYLANAEAVHEKLHDRVFLKGFRDELNIIIRTFIADLERIGTEGLAMVDRAGLTPEDFKGSSRSQMKALETVSEKLKLSDTFRKMADEVEECYTKTTPASLIDRIVSVYFGGLQAKMQELIERLDNGIIFYNTALLIKKHLNTLGILSDLSLQIKKLTNDQNTMLISDSNLLLHKIIDSSDTPFIYEKTGLRIGHFMLDEFQDTSVMQWKNFLPLISNSLAEGNDNLVVGDVKQSIYRWRNSDWKLLDSQVSTDFGAEQLKNESLSTNYRSDREIVEFNNELFSILAQRMQEKLNKSIEPVLGVLPELKPLTGTILNAYSQVVQHPKPDAGTGLVTFSFIDSSDSGDGWKEMSLQQLPAMVEHLQQRGYKPCDIAFLVRTNNEAKMVIEKLLNFKTQPEALPDCSYDIFGNEGLMIASASSVRFLSALLHLFVHPDEVVQQAIVSYEYSRGRLKMTDNDALAAFFRGNPDRALLCPHFTEEENAALLRMKQLSLFEMCEQIIHRFQLADWHGEAIFLRAFQDVIYSYSKGKSADLNSFLQWWDKHGINKTIPMPENEDAMRIMTIHKAKGLDFKVVIMPFCDWELNNRKRPVLWCTTNIEPFAQLPLLPVEYTSKLGESVFAQQYYSEMMHTYIDNLNIAYVAFTRARNEMHCLCPLPKTKKDGDISVLNLSALLYTTLNNPTQAFSKGNFDDRNHSYTFGEALLRKRVRTDKGTEPLIASEYPVALLKNRLRIRHRINNFSLEETEITGNPIDYGNLMHEIFGELEHPDQYQHLVDKLIRQGRINTVESNVIVKDMEAFRQLPEVQLWFQPGALALNETTIITPKGELYRPDRVLVNGSHATVVDYKFGSVEHHRYIRQVEHYGTLLQQMGYSCSAYICYVKLNKVVTVIE
jgi:ATP-dependent helicase/nuclease subunit A